MSTRRRLAVAASLFVPVAVAVPPGGVRADHTAAPASVTIAGDLQSELGCPGDWDPGCAATHLSADGAAWTGTFSMPPGNWSYKAALNDSWTENYGAGGVADGPNVGLDLTGATGPTDVTFLYSHETHWITDDVTSRIVTAPGSYQSELGCPGDWQPDCLTTWLQDVDGDGTSTFTTDLIPAGDYEAKAAIDRSWSENYGAGGVQDGTNIGFTVGAGQIVTFSFVSATNVLTIVAEDPPPPPAATAAVAGSFQEELGCPGDWLPDCDVTELVDVGNGVYRGAFTIPAGSWEYKVALNDTWDVSHPANNVALTVAAATEVVFYFDLGSGWVADSVDDRIVTAAGSFQSEIGCPDDWQPWCVRSLLVDPDGDGTFTRTFAAGVIPAGNYEAKAAIGEAWDESYPGANVAFTVTNQPITFTFVSATNAFTVDTGGGGSTDIEPGDELLVTAPSRPLSDETVYFVMTDRFANGDAANDTGGLPASDGKLVHGYDPTDKAFHHGGDLAGLTDQLDYIEGLGVSSIWITPPFTNDYVQLTGGPGTESSSYHGYWQVDFTQIDPHYGTNDEMRTFVDEAHARGIKVLFDVVLNHTGDVITYEEGVFSYRDKDTYPYRAADGTVFDDREFEGTGTFPELDAATSFPYTPIVPAGEEDAKAPAWLNDPIYYHNRGDSTFRGENSQYGDFFGLDDLFHEHPDVVAGMIDIHRAMIDEFDIDGMRVDTVKHVSDGFWEEWVPAVLDHATAAGKPDFVMFGEVFGESVEFRSRYSTELEFPGTLDFDANYAIKDFAARSQSPSRLADTFAQDDWYTDTDSNAHDLATFVGNHDEGRFGKDIVDANPGATDDELVARAVLGQAVNLLTRGRPVIYYGDEQGFVGDGGDQDARQDMFPSLVGSYNDDDLIGTAATTADANFDPTHPIYGAIADLTALRAAHPGLRTGAQLTRSAGGSVFAFSRIDMTEQVEYVVAVNNAEAPASATFDTDTSDASWTEVWPGGGSAATSGAGGTMTVSVPPLGVVVYRADTTVDQPDVVGIAMSAPAAGAEVTGRVEVGATVTTGQYAEVTFAVSVDGGPYEVIGVDDNAPHRVYHDVSGYPVGASLTFKAIAKDAAANLASDKVTVTVGEEAPPPSGDGPQYAIVHYQRSDGDYGDHTTGDFNDFWGLHLWGEAITEDEVTDWPAPKPFLGEDEYGRFAWIELDDATADEVNFIVHRGDTKDGTDADRSFDAAANPEIWLKQDDGSTYTSQAAAQGYVTIHYRRDDGDYGDPTSSNFEDFWGLHLWGDAIDPSEATDWPEPKPPSGTDDFGVYWQVAVQDVNQPVNYIIHRGDAKDRADDQAMVPADDASIFVVAGDPADHATLGSALDHATIHYHRPDGDYGDPTSGDFADFWGLHVWTGANPANPAWQDPYRPARFDIFGAVFEVPLVAMAPELAYIIHRGDTKDPGPDQFLDLDGIGHEVWQLQGADPESPYILPVPGTGGASVKGNLSEERAHWVAADTIVWPGAESSSYAYALCGAPAGGLALDVSGITGGDCIPLTPAGTYPSGVDGRRHLGGLPQFTIGADDLELVPELLRGQVAVVATEGGQRRDATGLQLPGVLDDLYATDAELGVVWDGDDPTVRLWAPTAKDVTLLLFDDSTTTVAEEIPMTLDGGVWSATGTSSWDTKYYLFEIEVYVPSTGAVETNLVTDPYSVSLSTNSTRSQIVDLADPELAPGGWGGTAKPELARPEDVSVYELHVRDFSIFDETVPAGDRGTFAAFTHADSNGMQHLAALADAGLSFVHLLPAFDIATIEEDASQRVEPDLATLESFPPDSDRQQELVSDVRDLDGFNWGYDPFHYTTPEGSYSTDPDGTTRVVEFREMVQSLNDAGLRVVMDVVYNHTHAAGQDPQSVLDRIVPGYYQRLNAVGNVETSTCCANTATEHAMMGKLMIDSVVTWAKQYRVDGFRFDLMGHHSKQNMADLRAALDELTLADDGVDGSKIYLYGEGWNFGEVANDARFVQATQLNMAGTGVGTFSDRLRDAVRGGGPFDGGDALVTNQGFVNGLWYDPNAQAMPESAALDRLLLSADQIRVGLAGNLADYTFVDRTGSTVTGSQVDYNGSPAGYTADPQENIVYVAAHDNQTLFDIGQYKHPLDTSTADRVRAQNVANAIVALAQGVPFVHAGQDLLRSKSMDRDSYNSGDWFNRLDLSYETNNWGVGLPPAESNADNWYLIAPRLAGLPAPAQGDIERNAAVTREWFEVRSSTPLFRLETADEIQARLSFGNTGPSQTPGLIAMSIRDDVDGLADLDPAWEGVEVLFNATDEAVSYTDASLAGAPIVLHPVLAGSVDPVVATSTFDAATGTFTVPARTAAVFVDLGPDVTPPTATADLERISGHGAWALYRVAFECTDDHGDATGSAELNGLAVEDGELVKLIAHPHQYRWMRNPFLTFMWGPSFELTVTCTDEAGNVSSTSTTADLSPPGTRGRR